MTETIAKEAEVPFLGANWFDPLEAGVRERIRGFIQNLLEDELAAALGRGRMTAAGWRATGSATGIGNCWARSGR